MITMYQLADVRAIRKELMALHEDAAEFEAALRDGEAARRRVQARTNRLYQMLGVRAFAPHDLPDEAA